jgi:hypothetical protein
MSIKGHVATLEKLQEKELEAHRHLQHIKDLEFTIDIQEAHKLNLRRDRTISRPPSAPPVDAQDPGIANLFTLQQQANEIMQEEQQLHTLSSCNLSQ